MQGQLVTKPMKAKKVLIKNSKPIADCIVSICGNFVIIATNEDDVTPTWYNQSLVLMIEGAELMQTHASGMRVGSW